jgi:hypothetical protein
VGGSLPSNSEGAGVRCEACVLATEAAGEPGAGRAAAARRRAESAKPVNWVGGAIEHGENEGKKSCPERCRLHLSV